MRENGVPRGAGSAPPHHDISSPPHPGPSEVTPTAVLLMNYGGPTRARECGPYLRNLFMDPDLIPIPGPMRPLVASLVARRRAPLLARNYEAMGGYSPTLAETSAQARALEGALGEGFRCFVGMRYWEPFIADTCREILAAGFRRIVLLPVYPHESQTTTGSSINEARRALKRLGYDGEVVEVRSFWDEPGYLKALAGQVSEALGRAPDGTRVLFSSHGLPVSVAKRDQYPAQVLDTVLAVCARAGVALDPITLPGVPERPFPAQSSVPGPQSSALSPPASVWRGALAWQSKVGPMKWLEPSVEHVLRCWGHERVRHIVLVPVAFVNEHSETLYELDVLYGDMARGLGTAVDRLPTLGVNPGFIGGLAGRVRQACAPK